MASSIVYLGVRGTVVALDRTTGKELWTADLKGTDFVNLLLDGNSVIATTKGEVFCLDQATGELQWHNTLPGLGRGIVTIATPAGGATPASPSREKKRRDEAAAGAAIAASS